MFCQSGENFISPNKTDISVTVVVQCYVITKQNIKSFQLLHKNSKIYNLEFISVLFLNKWLKNMQSLIYFCSVSIDDSFTIYFIISSFLFCAMSDIHVSSVCATNSRVLAAVLDCHLI